MTNGGVRSALTKVMNNMFKVNKNFNEKGFLTLGFAGHQINAANEYTNNGSTYLTSLLFLTLGLPYNHNFWTDSPKPWTSQNVWRGKPFPLDEHIN